jgi:Lon protease-like protein
VGTLARIVDWDQGENGLLNILVEGSQRFDIVETRVGAGQLVVADVVWREAVLASECTHAFGQLKTLVENLLQKNSASSVGAPLLAIEQPPKFVYTLLELLPLPLALKVEFLDIDETDALVNAALELLRALSPRRSHH